MSRTRRGDRRRALAAVSTLSGLVTVALIADAVGSPGRPHVDVDDPAVAVAVSFTDSLAEGDVERATAMLSEETRAAVTDHPDRLATAIAAARAVRADSPDHRRRNGVDIIGFRGAATEVVEFRVELRRLDLGRWVVVDVQAG